MPKEDAKISIIRLEEYRRLPIKLPKEEERQLMRRGITAIDRRKDEETNRVLVVENDHIHELRNPNHSGIYDVLWAPDEVVPAVVLCDYLSSTYHRRNIPLHVPNWYTLVPRTTTVIRADKRGQNGHWDAFIAPRTRVYVNTVYIGNSFKEIYRKFPETSSLFSRTRFSQDDVYAIFVKAPTGWGGHISSTFPFQIIDKDPEGKRLLVRPYKDAKTELTVTQMKRTRSDADNARQEPDTPAKLFEIAIGKTRGVWVQNADLIIVPDHARFALIDVHSCFCTDHAYPGVFSDPVSLFIARQTPGAVILKVSWYNRGNDYHVKVSASNNRASRTFYDPIAAFEHIVKNHRLRAEDAEAVMAIAKYRKSASFILVPRGKSVNHAKTQF